MKKGIIGLLLCVCMVVTMFVGCGSSTTDSKGNESENSEIVNNEKEVAIIKSIVIEDKEKGETIYEEYDEYGNIVEYKKNDSIIGTYTNEYDSNGMLLSAESSYDGYTSLYEYDEHGNEIYYIMYEPNGKRFVETKYEYVYDDKGNVLEKTQLNIMSGGQELDDSKFVEKFEYNENGDIWKMSEENYYRGEMTSEKEYKYECKYDTYGNIVEKKCYCNGEIFATYTWNNEYDNTGNLIAKTETKTNLEIKYEYKYDANGNLIEEREYKNGDYIKKTTYTYYE